MGLLLEEVKNMYLFYYWDTEVPIKFDVLQDVSH